MTVSLHTDRPIPGSTESVVHLSWQDIYGNAPKSTKGVKAEPLFLQFERAQRSESKPSQPPEPVKTSGQAERDEDEKREVELYYGKLRREQAGASKRFEDDVKGQGFIGSAFDCLKNSIGASSSNQPWYHPKALWSNLFDYDSGSEAIRKHIKEDSAAIEKVASTVHGPDGKAALDSVLRDTTVENADGSRTLKSSLAWSRYDSSQANGVEFVANTAALGAAVVMPLGGGGSIFAGMVTKAALKAMDGRYNRLASDVVTGGIAAAGPAVGRFASYAASGAVGAVGKLVGAAPGTLNFVSGGLAYGAEAGSVGAVMGGSQTLFDSRTAGATWSDSLSHSAGAALKGFGVGLLAGVAIGTPLQAINRVPLPKAVEGTLGNPDHLARQLDGAFGFAKQSGQPLAQALKPELNNLLAERGLPPLSRVTVLDHGSLLSPATYFGRLRELELGNPSAFNVRDSIAHELKHHEQSYQQILYFADRANLGRNVSAGDVQSLTTKLNSAGIWQSSDNVALYLQQRALRENLNLTGAQAARAKMLVRAEGHYPDVSKWYSQFNPVTLTRYYMNGLEREAYGIEKAVGMFRPFNSTAIYAVGALAGAPAALANR